MADTPVVRVIENGFRNVVIRATLMSDGSGLTAFKVFDATSSGDFGVIIGGRTFYPGVHTKLIGLDYDIQDMKLQILWDATSPEAILNLGNAPEDFNWRDIGGIPVPSDLVGATGSILLTTVDQQVNSTFSLILRLRKDIVQ